MSPESITIRRAAPDDLPAIVDVCGRALEWADPDNDAAFFRWKHVENPFGPSPIWVAEDSEQAADDGTSGAIVGVRAMMRWALRASDGPELSVVRAVDTATLPSHQGRGIFSRLTMGAVEALTEDGVAAVFNTPNDKSRPGYLKMGWQQIGRVPVRVQPRSPRTALAMVRSKVAADKWGIETDVGLDPAQALADEGPIDAAVAADRPRSGLSTPMSVDYLRWRTGFPSLAARIAPFGSSLEAGFIVFRLRRRGLLRQLTVLDVVGPASSSARRSTVRRLLRETGSDVVLSAGPALGWSEGLLPLPRSGPILTWRPLADPTVPDTDAIGLELGAIELF